MNKELNTIIEELKIRFEALKIEIPVENQGSLDFANRDIHSVLAFAKAKGFRQLSMLSCVDWIEENKFQLVYLLFNWQTGIRLQIRTRIDRDNPRFTTVTAIYPGAKYYERDVHEFFGVVFEGNPDSEKPLFLENWDDVPPLRKDFDPKAYSDKKYPARTYERNYSAKAGDPQ